MKGEGKTTKTKRKVPAEITAVDIAKDVLKLLDLEKLVAEAGIYCQFDEDVPMREAKKCRVCALGAATVALVRKTKTDEKSYSAVESSQALTKYFNYDQQSDIENAFEGWQSDQHPTRKFYEAHPGPHNRLRAIFQNIVDNKGIFIP